MKTIKCKFVDENLSAEDRDFLLPKRQTIQASGFDLVSAVKDDICLLPGERRLIATGIAVALPCGLELQVRSRSGLALKHGVVVFNSPGTVDADYRGEIKVILINHSQEPFIIKFGMRIAQMVIAPVFLPELVVTLSLDESTRGADGFGSTGLGEPYV